MPEIRTMKIIVAVMTLLIFVMGGAAVWKLAQGPALPPPAPATATSASPWIAELPEAGPILNIIPAGNNIAVMSVTPNGQVVHVFSAQSGKLVGTIKTAAK